MNAVNTMEPGIVEEAWAAELTGMLKEIQSSAGDQLLGGPTRAVIGPFLERGHLNLFLRIDQLWREAIERGEPVHQYETQLGPEQQYILRLVQAIFAGLESPQTSDQEKDAD